MSLSCFESICTSNQLPVTSSQIELLERYVALLLEWNKKVNLISRKDEGNVWNRHLLHAASLFFHISFEPNAKLLDLGTGGGLPGIPIKILGPALSVTLVDSTRKKTSAVADIVHRLSLTDVEVECGRAEELADREEFRNQFNYVVARGISGLKQLVQWSFPFLKAREGGLQHFGVDVGKMFIKSPALIAMKGGNLKAEIESARKDGRVKDIAVVNLSIKGLDAMQNPDRKALIVSFS